MQGGPIRTLVVAGVVTTAALAAGVMLGIGGWPGAPSGCIAVQDCYCEAFTGGVIQQPVNTLSNVGFILVGLWILASAHRTAERDGAGRMAADPRFPLLYGAVGVFLGIGSMYFHAAMTEWAGWIDLVSMHLLITYLLLYDVVVLQARSTAWFMRSFTIANLTLGLVLWMMDNGHGKFVFGALLVATLAVEYRLARAGSPVTRDRRWFWAGLGVYVFGQVIWLLSRDGAPLCAPDSPLQGHALWHLTGAATVFLMYRYLESERVRIGALASES